MIRFNHELQIAIDAARVAGARILDFYNAHTAAEYEKGDGSPVTDADLAADEIIRSALTSAFPDDAILTEESEDSTARLSNPRCWIVDPLDGTAQFIARTGQFDVMIALVVNHEPVLGVSYQPTEDVLCYATKGGGAWMVRNGVQSALQMKQLNRQPHLIISKYYGGNELADTWKVIANDLGATLSDVATVGYQPRRAVPPDFAGDVFLGLWPPSEIRFAREWDLAAPEIITLEAGGALTDAYGDRYQYNQPDTQISRGLIVSTDPALHRRVLDLVAREFLTGLN